MVQAIQKLVEAQNNMKKSDLIIKSKIDQIHLSLMNTSKKLEVLDGKIKMLENSFALLDTKMEKLKNSNLDYSLNIDLVLQYT